MRWLWFSLALAACGQPVDEPCLVSDQLTERDVSSWVENGRTILSVTTAECGTGACIRDRTVTPGPPEHAALGYCAVLCGARCLAGFHCVEVNRMGLCLREP